MKKQTLLSGTITLTLGVAFSKILGGVYRLALTGILGSEGIGIYQLIFPVFSLVLVLSSAGIPLAVSKLVADCDAQSSENCKKQIVKNSILITAFMSLLFCIILSLCCQPIAVLQGNAELKWLYLILLPAIFFSSVVSVVKGYFQGQNYFMPSAISQILEQTVKIGLGLLLSVLLIKRNVLFGVIGAIIAITISEIINFIYLWLVYYFKNKKQSNKSGATIDKTMIKLIISVALPFTLTSLILPLSNFFDSLIVIDLLKQNFSTNIATKLYGLQTGVVVSIINVPSMISFSLASVVLPSLALSFAKGDYEKCQEKIALVNKINLLICIPCALGCLFFGDNIIALIYGQKFNSINFAGAQIASDLLQLNAISILYLGFLQIYNMELQAMNQKYASVRNMLFAVALKTICIFVLLPQQNFHIFGFAIATVLCYAIAMFMNYLSLKKQKVYDTSLASVAKISFASITMIGIVEYFSKVFDGRFSFLIALAIGGLFYFSAIIMLKTFKKHEILQYFKKNERKQTQIE